MCKNGEKRMKKMASDFTISHLIRIAQWAEWAIRQMKDKPICKNGTNRTITGGGNNKKAHTANKKLWEKHTHLRRHSNPVEAG